MKYIDKWHQLQKQQDEEYEESFKIDHQNELQKQQDCEEQRHRQEMNVCINLHSSMLLG